MPKDTQKKDNQTTGNIGLYYVCYQLSRRGWNVMPTARNATGIDIVAYEGSEKGFIGIQVKTLSKRDPVPLSTSLEKITGDYWVIVTNVAAAADPPPAPDVFVMLPSEVKELAHEGRKNGKISYWLHPKSYRSADYQDAWHRLEGRTDDKA